jgi:CMP-2-keto-3-deoxyoctulosonic acid synthetase
MKKTQVKISAVIPARYGSTRFEGKPLAEILANP